MAEIDVLRAVGMMPGDAERILAQVEARGGRLMDEDALDAAAEVTRDDVAAARTWWLYQPYVPWRLKRVLEAVEQAA